MQIVDVRSNFANTRVVALERDVNRNLLMRHAIHQLVRQFRNEFGDTETNALVDEVSAYHVVRVVGVR